MPRLIRTPEEIFRAEGKDIYVIRFKNGKTGLTARKEMIQWLHAALPQTPHEDLAPSEYSGFRSGYGGDLRVDFTEPSLETFSARWETPDGDSIDPRFQCYLMLHGAWHDRIAGYPMTLERPTTPGLAKWWDTPRGIVHHQISAGQARADNLTRHPCGHRDLWYNAVSAVPAFASLDPDELIYGEILEDADGTWRVLYCESYRNKFTDERRKEILEWFGLPPDTLAIANDG